MAQKLSFSNIAVPDQKTIEQASFQGYTGPTPPPGKYKAKLAGVQIQTRDTGNVFVVRYVINETGELKKYNEAEQYYKQAYGESLQMGELEQAQQMIQASVLHKLSTLELLTR
mgnify:CR=1 FL=1